MKTLWVMAGVLAVLVLGIGAGVTVGYDRGGRASATSNYAEDQGMLGSDMAMLESMRVFTSPAMMTMIRRDPMWTDPDMIRAQEEYQAQLDRMVGKRGGQP